MALNLSLSGLLFNKIKRIYEIQICAACALCRAGGNR